MKVYRKADSAMNHVEMDAPAKINLYLDIVGIGRDGYHNIETIFQTISLCDRLKVVQKSGGGRSGGKAISLKVHSPRSSGNADKDCPADRRNIVWRAVEFFRNKYGAENSYSIILNKHIPIQAGLGGGSSDAAAALKAMAQLLRNRRAERRGSENENFYGEIASQLGADVPFFMKGGCALATGVGDKIMPIEPAPQFWAVVVKPEIGLSTKEVYGWFDAYRGTPRLTNRSNLNKMKHLIKESKPVSLWSRYVFNCFENVVFSRVPELKQIKEFLLGHGALCGSLSGSGSAFFGIVNSKSEAVRIKRKLDISGVKTWVVRSAF